MSNKTQADTTEYMLGHGDREWDRLHRQHAVWRDTLLDFLPKLGAGPGSRLLEVGCGNGVLLRDLALHVGPQGHVVGIERDPDAAGQAAQYVADLPWVEVHQGDLFALEPAAPEDAFDLVVARWVIAWLPSPDEAVRRLVPQVRPGGRLLIQDYNYDAIRVEPEQLPLRKLFEIMPQAYALHGGDAWSAMRLPRLFVEAGLDELFVEPHCKAGDPDSGVFRWAERFFREHVQRLVDDGLLTAEERQASLEAWDTARATPGTVFFSPLVVNVAGRRPATP